jgi:hypothetical protein
MRLAFVPALLIALLSIGCGATTSSKNIRTAGVVALIDVTADRKDNAVVNTELVVGGASSNTSLVLDGGDTLYAQAGGERKQLMPVGGEEYEARFTKGKEFTVSFERDGDDQAPNSKGTLPDSFEITSSFGSDAISRKDDSVTIEWSPSGTSSDVEIEIEGDCIHDERYRVGGDPGSYTIPKGEIRAWKSKAEEDCNVVVEVKRTNRGDTDPALDPDSRFLLHQVRTARFVSGP